MLSLKCESVLKMFIYSGRLTVQCECGTWVNGSYYTTSRNTQVLLAIKFNVRLCLCRAIVYLLEFKVYKDLIYIFYFPCGLFYEKSESAPSPNVVTCRLNCLVTVTEFIDYCSTGMGFIFRSSVGCCVQLYRQQAHIRIRRQVHQHVQHSRLLKRSHSYFFACFMACLAFCERPVIFSVIE